MDAQEQYARWHDQLQGPLALELEKLNPQERQSRFSKTLRFGTAGIRAKMELGPGGINEFTVARTACGIGAYLAHTVLPKRCAIGYDSRCRSREFAQLCARALAEQAIEVFLFDRVAPTPMVSFAVRRLECGVGIVISASHNTKEYNGLKCYGPDGGQMTQEQAAQVLEEIERTPWFRLPQTPLEQLEEKKLVQAVTQQVWQDYYKAVLGQLYQPEQMKKAGLQVVYSPLCGAGAEPVGQILGQLGVTVAVPESQRGPSGEFATCPVPNPEEEQAFAEAYRLAEDRRPDLILATDPDSDRIAAAIPAPTGFRKFSGNELGCLLLDYLLLTGKRLGKLPKQPVAVTSVVSTPMAEKIARHYGCQMVYVLTGFKYIGQTILQLERAGREGDFLFGFEESCGFLKGSYVRDKDGVEAAALLCEMTAYWKANKLTLSERLEQLYGQFGFWQTRLESIAWDLPERQERGRKLLGELRTMPVQKLGTLALRAIADYSAGTVRYADGRQTPTGLPQETMLGLWTEDGGRIMLRPSGTEPKLKLYYAAQASTRQQAEARLQELQAQMAVLL